MSSRSRSCWWLLLVAWLSVLPAHALINPKYTPVNLVKDAKVILQLELSPPSDKGGITAKVTAALKGEAPEKLAFTVDREDSALQEAIAKTWTGKSPVPALYFSGDSFAGAVDSGDASETSTAALSLGDVWYSLLPDDKGRLQLTEDALDLKAVWSGGTESISKLAAWILADPKAEVPVAGDVTWTDSLSLKADETPFTGSLPVQLTGSELPGVLLLSEKGDRFFQFNSKEKKFEDLSAKLKLASHSRFASAADLNADGRLDLATSDGHQVQVQLLSEDGTLKMNEMPLWSGDVLGLASGRTASGRPAILVSTSGSPVLVSLDEVGKPVAGPVVSGEFDHAKWGNGRASLLADFTGDGREDIVQPCDQGILFYQAEAFGKWLPPVLAAPIAIMKDFTAGATGDFDADGLLDVVLAGEKGWHLLLNRGGGKFSDSTAHTGEANYSAQGKMSGVFDCDLNRDGRDDLAFLRDSLASTPFFNRGFGCFGFSEDLDFKNNEDLAASIPLSGGQLSGFAADLNGDGVQEIVMVSAKGDAWVLFSKTAAAGRVSVGVASSAGPLVVTARDGKRDLGARLVTPANPAFFGKREKGPLQLTWKYPDSAPQTRSIVVIKPMSFVIPAAKPAP